jgi:hypothetical protein
MYEFKAIHRKFTEWLDDLITTTAQKVISHVTVDLSVDQLYDALVPKQHHDVLLAASVLMSSQHDQVFPVTISNRLEELPTRSQYIFTHVHIYHSPPAFFLFPRECNVLRENTSLAEYLLPALHLTREFAMLQYVVKQLIDLTEDRDILSGMFPWLPDLIAESGWKQYQEVKVNNHIVNKQWMEFYVQQLTVKSVSDRLAVDRSFATASKRSSTKPPMHSEVRQVAAALGTKLFTQYRLAKERPSKRITNGCIIPTLTPDLIPPSLINAMDETKKYFRYQRELYQSKKVKP